MGDYEWGLLVLESALLMYNPQLCKDLPIHECQLLLQQELQV